MIRARINVTEISSQKIRSVSIPGGDWYLLSETIEDEIVPGIKLEKTHGCRVQVSEFINSQYNRSISRTYHGISAQELFKNIKAKFKK